MQSDFAGHQIDLLIDAGLAGHAGIEAQAHIHHAVLAKAFDGLAGMSVQFDQAEAGGDIDNAVIAPAVSPIGNAAPRKLAG